MKYAAVSVLIALTLGLLLASSGGAADVSHPDAPQLEEMLSPSRSEPWYIPIEDDYPPDTCFYREYEEGTRWLGPWRVNEDCGPVTMVISEP